MCRCLSGVFTIDAPVTATVGGCGMGRNMRQVYATRAPFGTVIDADEPALGADRLQIHVYKSLCDLCPLTQKSWSLQRKQYSGSAAS